MAENLQLLKRRIRTAKNISQIAKAMEMIAASKIKRAQTAVSMNKPYAEKIIEHTNHLLSYSKNYKHTHPYLQQFDTNRKLLIVISPDKGLCGGLVTNLLKKVFEYDSNEYYIITYGRKVERIAHKLKAELIASFPMGGTIPSFSSVYPLRDLIHEYYNTGKVSSVEIIYSEFESFFTQLPTHKKVLPITPPTTQETHDTSEYLFEPSQEVLLNALLPYYVEITLYSTLLESYTSEQAARMVAMQNAKNNARDIADALTLLYNKSRQERITNELLDLTNGQVAA